MKHLFIGTYSAGRANPVRGSQKSQPEWAALWQPSLRWLTFEIPGGGAYRMWGRDQLAGFVCSDFQSVSKDCGRLLARLVGVNKKNVCQKKQKSENKKEGKGAENKERDKNVQRIMAANIYLVNGYWCENLSVPWICKGTVMSCPTA